MKSTVETLDDHKVKLSVEVEADEIEIAVDEAFRQLAREVRLPGFRPGKAPRKVLEARLGKGYARSQALENALPDYYRQAAIEHDVDVISAPELELTGGHEEGSVTFDAVVAIRPTVTVSGHGSLAVEIEPPAVAEEEIDEQIDQLREQFAERVTVQREATDGDYVVMNITTNYEGEEVAGLTATDYTYEVGAGGVVDELDENLRGTKAGAILSFEADHPDEEETGRLAFSVLVKEVQAKQLPDLDDAFVEEASEFETVDELRADTEDRIAAAKRVRARQEVMANLATAVAELVEIEIPEPLVEEALQNRVYEMVSQLAAQNIELGQFLEMTGQSQESFIEQLREPAAESAKVDLGLRAIAIVEELDVTEDELDAELTATAEAIGRDVDTIRGEITENGRLSGVRWDMRKQKAMEWVLDNATITDTEGTVHSWDALREPEVDETETDETEGAESEADETEAGDTEETEEPA